MNVGTISNELERKYLCQDLLTERDSDEDGGIKTRVEFDSDFSYESAEENVKEEVEVQPPGTNWSEVLDKKRPKGNTGPKGVKADYEQAKRITARRNETKRLEQEEAFKRMVYGTSATASAPSAGTSGAFVKAYDADADDDDSDDDEFLEAYRMQRMKQALTASSMPQFGRLLAVDRFEFLDHVDKADARTHVVIHLYENYINNCQRMNDILDRIARRHSHVKFLKLEATEADQELSHTALPAFLVYKGGVLVNDPGVNVVKSEFEGNPKFSEGDVEWLLAAKFGIDLPGVDISQREREIGVGQTMESQTTKDEEKDSGYVGTFRFRSNHMNRFDEDEDDIF